MALTKPIINDIVAFDSTVGATITFNATATEGSIINGNEIKVVTNDASETTVYNHTVTSHNLSHNIPANTLTNGRYYKVAIRTIDEINNRSEWSNYQPFYCYTTPNISLNISSGQTISNTSFTFILTYTQAQNEQVNYATIKFYRENGSLISSSGNIYPPSSAPITFNYTVYGLQTNTNYKVKATLETINGTIVETAMIPFTVSYTLVDNDNKLVATVDSCNGYINVRSNIITKMDITSNPDPLIYIKDDTMADLINTISDMSIPTTVGDNPTINQVSWAKWSRLEIPKNFLLRMWFYPSRQPFEVLRLTNNLNGRISSGTTYLKVSLQRGTTTDYLSIRTNNGTTIDKALNTFCNGNTKVFLWIKVIGNTWDVRTSILETDTTILNWNDSTDNIQYNVTSDIAWGGEPYGTFVPSSDTYSNMSNNLSSAVIANGIFDELVITSDTSIPYSTDIPIITPQTLLMVDFNGEIGSNSNYTRLLLKRKDDSMTNWINIVDINNIPYGVPVYINFDDSFVPSNVEQTYGLVTYTNNTISEVYTIQVTPIWGKYFISDKTNRFPLNYAVIYSNHNQNIQNGVFMPIGAQYPIVIQNAKGNYRSGSLQFKVLGYQYEENMRLNRRSIVEQTDDILEFLTNNKAKCITDFNGNIFIIKVINSPQISYDANWGNGVTTISFDWVEQGKYNNGDDMVALGLFDYVAAE